MMSPLLLHMLSRMGLSSPSALFDAQHRPTIGFSGQDDFSDPWSRDMGDNNTISLADQPVRHDLSGLSSLPDPRATSRVEGDSYGFMMPKSYGGGDVDERTAHQARGAAFLQLGQGLLAGAQSGRPLDILQGLTRGAQGGLEAYQGVLGHNRDLQRQASVDARAEQQAQDAHLASEQERNLRTTQAAHQQKEWTDEDAKKVKTAQAAAAMVAAIEKNAGPGSPEAQQARALATLGEDVDLGRLESLHNSVINRSHLGEDIRTEASARTEAQIDTVPRLVKAGVIEDPLAPGRRADRGLDFEAQRLAIERQREADYRTSLATRGTGSAGGPGGKMPTTAQFETDVATETNRLLAASPLALRTKHAGEVDRTKMLDPKWAQANPGKIPLVETPSMAEVEAERQQAEAIARRNVLSRYQGYKDSAGAPASGGNFDFDPTTGTWNPR